MTPEQVIELLKEYESKLSAIRDRFTISQGALHMHAADKPKYRQYVQELIELYDDVMVRNSYSSTIAHEFATGTGMYGPHKKGLEEILSVVKASITRLQRSPDAVKNTTAAKAGPGAGPGAAPLKENVFIIHGQNEAKWRELKDLLKSFGLNPIVLAEQPEGGCTTIIDKFERYAQTCSFAIALFTPDDQVRAGASEYLQARPNVIYELGWFCGKYGRHSVMLLLKEGTNVFSDFGGIIQKRFNNNVSEQAHQIRKELEAAGVLQPAL